MYRSPAQPSVALVAVLSLCLATGCVAPKRAASFVVPKRCIKVDAQSFTRPCKQLADGKIVCDGVVVTATCVQAAR